MFSFFNSKVRNYRGQITNISYKFKTDQRYLQTNSEKTLDYYSNTTRFLSSHDLLYRIVKFIGVNEYSLIDYMGRVDNLLATTYRMFHISSYFNHGKFTDLNHLYISHTKTINIFDTAEVLLEIPALEILASDTKSLYSPHPLLETESFSIRGIDVRLMMLQYYHWSKVEENSDVKDFIMRVVYKNAINSMSNIAIINRFMFTDDIDTTMNMHPFPLVDISQRFSRIISSYNKDHSKGGINIVDIFRDIPTVHGNALGHLSTEYPVFNGYNSLPYFYIYARLMYAAYNQMNGRSRRVFKSKIRSERIILNLMRSLGLHRMDFGPLTEEKNALLEFFQTLTKG